MTGAAFTKLALSLPGTAAAPHMDRTAFRTPRKIFATLAADGREANVLLDLDEQAALAAEHPGAIYPVAGGWGRMGYTTLVLATLDAPLVRSILLDAHALAAPKVKKAAAKKTAAKRAAAKKPRARKTPKR